MRVIITAILLIVCTSVFAQNPSGCIIVFPYGAIGSYPGVYPTPLGINVPSGQNADIVGLPAYSSSNGIPVSYSCYRNPNPTSTRECAVRVPNGNSYIWYGGVFAQKYYQCPIDENLLYLMIFLVPISFFAIRRFAYIP